MTRRTAPLQVAEAAWGLTELCRIGLRCAAGGRCIGELAAQDVVWRGRGLSRARPTLPDLVWRHPAAAARHRKRGHDAACVCFGVPRVTIERLLGAWCGAEGAALLCEAMAQAVEEVCARPDSAEDRLEALSYAIGGRITVRAPADRV